MTVIFKHFRIRRHCAGIAAFLALLGMGLSSPAQADADDSCVVQISHPLIDYGQVDRTRLFPEGVPVRESLLGKRTISLTTVCEAQTAMSLSFRGEAADELRYRFARDGVFRLRIVSAQLDGKAVRMGSTHQGEGGQSAVEIRPGVSLSPHDGSRIVTGKHLSVVIEVETYMSAKTASVKTQEVLSGSGQFELLTH